MLNETKLSNKIWIIYVKCNRKNGVFMYLFMLVWACWIRNWKVIIVWYSTNTNRCKSFQRFRKWHTTFPLILLWRSEKEWLISEEIHQGHVWWTHGLLERTERNVQENNVELRIRIPNRLIGRMFRFERKLVILWSNTYQVAYLCCH